MYETAAIGIGENARIATWHYGLIARWWAEFNFAEPHELEFYRAAIRKFGEPVLDLGCGTGRLLVPLVEEGFDVDGVDVSADMIAQARRAAATRGLNPGLSVQPMHALTPDRSYRTVYICGALGLGSSHDEDRETLLRVHDALQSGGGLLITDHEPPPANPPRIRSDWPATGERRRTSDGEEIELIGRLAGFDAAEHRLVREMRARLWRGDTLVTEEGYRLTENAYSAEEMTSMVEDAGFTGVTIAANYSDRPPGKDDRMLTFTAIKP